MKERFIPWREMRGAPRHVRRRILSSLVSMIQMRRIAYLNELQRLQKEYLVDVEDAVAVVRDSHGKVRMKQTVDLVGPAAASGALWGGLWGSLVFSILSFGLAAGAAFGAGSGALAASLADYSINDDFIRSVGEAERRNGLRPMPIRARHEDERTLIGISSAP